MMRKDDVMIKSDNTVTKENSLLSAVNSVITQSRIISEAEKAYLYQKIDNDLIHKIKSQVLSQMREYVGILPFDCEVTSENNNVILTPLNVITALVFADRIDLIDTIPNHFHTSKSFSNQFFKYENNTLQIL